VYSLSNQFIFLLCANIDVYTVIGVSFINFHIILILCILYIIYHKTFTNLPMTSNTIFTFPTIYTVNTIFIRTGSPSWHIRPLSELIVMAHLTHDTRGTHNNTKPCTHIYYGKNQFYIIFSMSYDILM